MSIEESAGAAVEAAVELRILPEQIGQEGAAQRVDHADEDRGQERAADRADAADHDDDEGEDEDVLAHPDLDRQNRRLHQPGETGERGP